MSLPEEGIEPLEVAASEVMRSPVSPDGSSLANLGHLGAHRRVFGDAAQVAFEQNLGSHKGTAGRAAIGAAGAELHFLPAYSPDPTSIENAFSKLKALLRKAAARTRDALWAAVAKAIDALTPEQCANFFSAAGYEPDSSDFA